jgi:hypothetical protein
MIMIGFIVLILGIIVLTLAGSDFEGGFVFIFPFFFFGDIGSLGIIPIIGLVLFLVVTLILFYSSWIRFSNPDVISKEMKTYIKYDTYCTFCGEPMPKTARYCPTCGQLQEESNQLD